MADRRAGKIPHVTDEGGGKQPALAIRTARGAPSAAMPNPPRRAVVTRSR